jgi:hypothetical protein
MSDGTLDIEFRPIQHPFTPTELLQKHLKKYSYHYGCGGRENIQWRPETIGWQFIGKGTGEMGFAWLTVIDGKPDERDFLMAVYDEYSRKNLGNIALKFVESSLNGFGIKKLLCQVNSHQGIGLVVRKWLYKNGFQVIKRPTYASMPDEQYLEKGAFVVHFQKTF